jgi:hypothetical protein
MAQPQLDLKKPVNTAEKETKEEEKGLNDDM